MKYILKPNLPQNKVTKVICSNNNSLINALDNYNIECIVLPKLIKVDDAISDHTDVKINHLGLNNFMVEKSLNVSIKGANLIPTNSFVTNKYPNDCILNSVNINNTAICNFSALDKKLIDYYNKNSIDIINVNQAYAKCNICVVDDNSFITSDLSIYKKAKNNFDILLIEPGHIIIDRYDYGFIGGCTGKIDIDKIAFYGDIKTHSDYTAIKKFLFKKDIEAISLIKGTSLIDIGSIIPIEE